MLYFGLSVLTEGRKGPSFGIMAIDSNGMRKVDGGGFDVEDQAPRKTYDFPLEGGRSIHVSTAMVRVFF